MTKDSLQPIRKVLVVGLAVNDAFAVFTRDIGRWWPLGTHSLEQERATGCGLENRVGGALYEMSDAAGRQIWARIVAYSPPSLLGLSWAPGDLDDAPTDVQLRFTGIGHQRSRVELVHAGWSASKLERYVDHQKGWDAVLVKGYQAYAQTLVDG